MNYKQTIQEIGQELCQETQRGLVASYIPELAKISINKFGISLQTVNYKEFNFGDYDQKFSIQSISKVFSLALAYKYYGEQMWHRVGVEPSGEPFNSLIQLEYENGIPRNPFINAGALVICDMLCDVLENPKKDFLAFVRLVAGNNTINYNPNVANSEQQTGYRNISLINLMKSFGNIINHTDKVLDFYFSLCSIEMTCKELALAFLPFAHYKSSKHKMVLGPESRIKRMNAIMQTCGFYDEAGEFTFRVGLPGKSGVGGGIAAIHPGQYSVAVWSPGLNPKGNSLIGMKALELLTSKLKLSIF